MTSASVLIRTKNEARALGATLEAVFDQAPPPHEVIVIDSGSTDGTVAIAARYPVRLLEINPRQWSYPRALNTAASYATGDILICLSAHCLPVGRDWLARMLRHFDDPIVAAVWGPGRRPGTPPPGELPPQRQLPGSYTAVTYRTGMSNHNSAIRRCLWEQVPFDEALPAAEDKAWAAAMLARGYVIVHDPTALVWHAPHPPLHAYRRNRAIAQGLRLMFPELRQPIGPTIRDLARTTRQRLGTHLHERDPAAIWQDLWKVPAVLSGLIGSLRGRRLGQ